jgi:hypothetical protein
VKFVWKKEYIERIVLEVESDEDIFVMLDLSCEKKHFYVILENTFS